MRYTYSRLGDIEVSVPCKLVASSESEFQQISIIDTKAWGRCLILDGVVNTSSRFNVPIHESLYAVPYEVCKPKSALILGGGDLIGAKMCLDLGLERVVVVDIDKNVVELSIDYLHDDTRFVDDHRLDILYEDAALFVDKNRQQFDMVIIDMTDPDGISADIYASEFITKVHKLVGGILCSQCDSPDTIGSNYYSIVNAYRTVFEHSRPFRVWIPSYLELFGRLLASPIEITLPQKIGNYSWLTVELFHAMFGMFSKLEKEGFSACHAFQERSSVNSWSIE